MCLHLYTLLSEGDEDWGIYVYVTMSQDGCNVVVAQHSLSGGHVTTDSDTGQPGSSGQASALA